MHASTGGTEGTRLSIFPLSTVLYPGGRLALKIFEQRYLEMTKACLRDGSPFGVCRIREGLEVGTPAVPDEVGCTATIDAWDMPHPGLFQLLCRGGQAFRILEHATQPDGLIVAQIELLEDAAGAIEAEAAALCRQVLEQIIARVGPALFSQPLQFEDGRWVSYRLAEVLPLNLAEKQALLELRETGARLLRLQDLIKRMG